METLVHNYPKHIVAVSACIANKNNEILLVKTHWRADTWELPGGQVEEGEPLDKAVCREILEETGIVVKPNGITGIYYNASSEILSVVFKADYISGKLKIQEEEIKEAKFVAPTEVNISSYITRPHMLSRTIDAMNSTSSIPYETWETSPYKLLSRLENDA